ncbi:MAG TPA: hypothetical protein VL907_06475 [Pyrinomonadaceae bacterium]|jgi:phosphate/sulfate permease|nr:hypothetical protein [Pyrinomonadaceae bacterium]
MRIRRAVRSMSTFVSGVAGALVKALVTSIVLGAVLVSIMHYMGVPVPSAHDLLGGISRLARRS